jgi:two-component system sensor histidine kinase VicK
VGLFKRKASGVLDGGLAVSANFFKDRHLNSDFILGGIDDGVIMVDRNKVIQLFNRAAGTITGWDPNEAIGQDFSRILPMVDAKGTALPPEQHPVIQALVSGKVVKNSDFILQSKNGKQIYMSVVVSPVGEAGRQADTVAAIFRDITQEKAQEQQRSDFISTASHEMRTPITAIEGYLSLALNEKICKIDEPAKKYLVKALDSTHHLGQLFSDLLTSSKADDGRLASNPVVVELGEVVAEVVENEQFHAREKNLELKFMVSSNNEVAGGRVVRPLYYTFVDPTRITEVVQNLIDNGLKYTPQGSITVRLTGDAHTVQVQVQDTGPGIATEDIPHLFQKFYRIDNSATRTIGGTGLGLYICKRIIELYEGRIWVESQLGHGSVFFINLPRLTTQEALEKQHNQASVVSPAVN